MKFLIRPSLKYATFQNMFFALILIFLQLSEIKLEKVEEKKNSDIVLPMTTNMPVMMNSMNVLLNYILIKLVRLWVRNELSSMLYS
jgi:hypothetical protein